MLKEVVETGPELEGLGMCKSNPLSVGMHALY